ASCRMFAHVASPSERHTPSGPNLDRRKEISLLTCGRSGYSPLKVERPTANPTSRPKVICVASLSQMIIKFCNEGMTAGTQRFASGSEEYPGRRAAQGIL